MRQGQQNRRGRGRNRKSQNPLTRSFESNGPDVKIRGTPSHIAEKYISLARDAQSSGDPVLAESYLQHAEHYNRIIMAFREQQVQQGGGDPAQLRRLPGADFGEGDDFGDEDGDEGGVGDFGNGVMGANEPQPTIRNFEAPQQRQEGNRDGGRGENRSRGDNRGEQRGRGDFQFRQNRDRHHNGSRHGEHRGGGGGGQGEGHGEFSRGEPQRREPRDNRDNRPEGGGRRGGGEGRGRRDFGNAPAADEQPEFLRRSVRRPRREEGVEASSEAPQPTVVEDNAE